MNSLQRATSSTGHQGLYPIIRRVRRPLLPVDPPAESKPVSISQPEESKPPAAETPDSADEKKTDAEDSNK
jgi:hypothetical protein